MEFFDEINSLEYLYLVEIKNLPGNKLSIIIKEATIANEEKDLIISGKNIGPVKGISFEGPGKVYQCYFKSYGAYCVVNESFSTYNDNEEWEGRLFCIYSKSNYLDFIRETTLVDYTYVYDGDELKHYAINCLDHTIYIVTTDEPIITRE